MNQGIFLLMETGMCKDAGKSYAVYVISVFRATQDGTNSWSVYRRYSDFDDLHMRIKDKVCFGLLHCTLVVLTHILTGALITVWKYNRTTSSWQTDFP